MVVIYFGKDGGYLYEYEKFYIFDFKLGSLVFGIFYLLLLVVDFIFGNIDFFCILDNI